MTKKLSPREFSRMVRDEVKTIIDRADKLCKEYAWAYDAADAPTVGDRARARSYASRPTENVALDGYPPPGKEEWDPVESDTQARGKARLRKELAKCTQHTKGSLVSLQNDLDTRADALREAMRPLRPGPSKHNPEFEKTVSGDSTLLDSEMGKTYDAQGRRQQRREDPPLICTCRMIDRGSRVEFVPTAQGRCAVHWAGAVFKRRVA